MKEIENIKEDFNEIKRRIDNLFKKIDKYLSDATNVLYKAKLYESIVDSVNKYMEEDYE